MNRANLPKMTVLVVGGDGLIGSALVKKLTAKGYRVLKTSRNKESIDTINLDLLNVDLFLKDSPPSIDVLIIAAAITKFEECRKNPEEVYLVNVKAPVKLVEYYSKFQTKIIFLSTSSIFNGSQKKRLANEMPDGNSAYGIFKIRAERALGDLNANVSIIRFSKVVSPTNNLFTSWITDLSNGNKIRCFQDQYISPISLETAVAAIISIMKGQSRGTYQLSANDDVSYFEIGEYLTTMMQLSHTMIEPIKAIDQGIPDTEIFRYNSLDCSRLEKEFSIDAPGPFEFIKKLT